MTKREAYVDYRALILLGIVFMIIGVGAGSGIFVIGFVFFIIGLAKSSKFSTKWQFTAYSTSRNRWGKQKLTPEQEKLARIVFIVLFLVFFLIAIVMFVLSQTLCC